MNRLLSIIFIIISQVAYGNSVRWNEGYRAPSEQELSSLIGVWSSITYADRKFYTTITIAVDGSMLTEGSDGVDYSRSVFVKEGKIHVPWGDIVPETVTRVFRDAKSGKIMMELDDGEGVCEMVRASSRRLKTIMRPAVKAPENSIPYKSNNTHEWGSYWYDAGYFTIDAQWSDADEEMFYVLSQVWFIKNEGGQGQGKGNRVYLDGEEVSLFLESLKESLKICDQSLIDQKPINEQVKIIEYLDPQRDLDNKMWGNDQGSGFEGSLSVVRWCEKNQDEVFAGIDLAVGSRTYQETFSFKTEVVFEMINEIQMLKPQQALSKRIKLKRYLRRASQAGADHAYAKEIENYTGALDIDPKNDIAYTERASAYDQMTYQTNDDEQKMKYLRLAIEDYSSALKLDPKGNYRLYLYRANVYERLHEFDHQAKDYSAAIELCPIASEAYLSYLLGRGDAYYLGGEYDKALSDYNAAIGHIGEFSKGWADGYSLGWTSKTKNNKISRIYVSLAKVDVATKEYEKAEEAILEAIKLNSDASESKDLQNSLDEIKRMRR